MSQAHSQCERRCNTLPDSGVSSADGLCPGALHTAECSGHTRNRVDSVSTRVPHDRHACGHTPCRVSLKREDRAALVDRVLHDLGLVTAADTTVGTTFIKGISGGQKRRLSIACKVLAGPSLMFLDEPTSGVHILSTLAANLGAKRFLSRPAALQCVSCCTIPQVRYSAICPCISC
jgi:ABC-type dipeptide/oligopeptide/nickel transport system ATPase component